PTAKTPALSLGTEPTSIPQNRAGDSPHPRGPRSGLGCSVPIHHHLIDPIRPTRRHVQISPHCDLYRTPSLCGSASATRERFRTFACCSVRTCRSLCPRRFKVASIQFLHH